MTPAAKYLWLTLKHKWFVFLAGRRVGVNLWRLIVHDWTKLTPRNLHAYGRQFFGDKGDSLGFVYAWVRHQNAHDHHWEYWIPRTGHNRCEPPYPDNVPVPMPDQAIREMVADWMGASRAYEGRWPTPGNWTWFKNEYPKIAPRLHIETRMTLERLIFLHTECDAGFPASAVMK